MGHNPYRPSVVDVNLVLPTHRPPLLVEELEQQHTTGGTTGAAVDPNQLWASRRCGGKGRGREVGGWVGEEWAGRGWGARPGW